MCKGAVRARGCAGRRTRATSLERLRTGARASAQARLWPCHQTGCGVRSRVARTERVVCRHRHELRTRAGATTYHVAIVLRRRHQGTRGRASAGFKAQCEVASGRLLHVGAARRVRGEKSRHASRARAAARAVRRKHRIEISSCVLGRAVRRRNRLRGAGFAHLRRSGLPRPGRGGATGT
jgi:hypothetical protein